MKKIAICWIGIGKYNSLFDDFYRSFNEKFCCECDRTFFVFTDDIENKGSHNDCVFYRIDHACTTKDFVLFRKFKYLMMAEDRFLDYDYVVFCNGNLICKEEVRLNDIVIDERKVTSV